MSNLYFKRKVSFSESQKKVLQEAFRAIDVERSGTVDTEHLQRLVGKLLRKDISNDNNNVVRQRKNSQNTLKNGAVNFTDFVEIMSETLAESNDWGSLKTEVEGYVGIDSIQEQIRKKALKRGFEYNIMVVGPSGLGKSTLVNSLFRAKVSRRACSTEDSQADAPPIPQSVQVKSVSHVIEESGVRLKLTVTDTPGFGDHINNENCWIPIIEFINEQYEKFLSEEVSITRKKHIPDSRVHVCLYFVAPTGHNLKPLDIEVMKRLDKVCNVMPVISKADTLTMEERATFKNRIKEELKKHGVQTYPMKGVNEDAEDAKINDALRDQIPFAVVGSDKTHELDGKKVLGRLTNWGLIEVENPKHCEFSHLRDMLIRTHMQDLKEVTDSVHYENFRRERLSSKKKLEKADESRC